jgi:hypothetical protein
MQLRYDFTLETRLLYLGHWECFLCGQNGQETGGLDIHHILGRVSDCAFNSSCLCRKCHIGIRHEREEHIKIFAKTLEFLTRKEYKPKDEDWAFLERNVREILRYEQEGLDK